MRATLAFLEKITLAPDSVTPADARAVLAAGVSKQMVKDALYVATLFNLINRLADAFDFAIPEEAGFVTSAKALLWFGYRL